MRILFFGTPDFAVPSFEALAAAGHVMVAAITQPDRPRGRGQHVQPTQVKAAALKLGVPVLQPTKIRDEAFASELKAMRPDLGVVAAFGRILPAHLLGLPRLGMINVHASLLPRWRGAAPVQRAIIAGDRETGVTIMRVVEKLDAGPMLAKESTTIEANETSEALEQRLAMAGAGLLVKTVAALASGPVNEDLQDEALVTYASKIEKHESAIDWNQPSQTVHDLIRGLRPWPSAAAMLGGKRVLLRSSVALPDFAHSSQLGVILEADRTGIVVATSPGAVRLLELQPEGRSAMPVAAFLNGHAIHPGDRLERPSVMK